MTAEAQSLEMTPEQYERYVSMKKRSPWSDRGLLTARNDLIEHGKLFVDYEDLIKIAVLDMYLWASGLRFNRIDRNGKYQVYTLIGMER